MSSLQAFGLPVNKIIEPGEAIFPYFTKSLQQENITLQHDDVIVIASKIVAVEQQDIVKLASVTPSQQAKEWSEKSAIDPRVVELILKESTGIYGNVYKAILTMTPYGLNANAGIDLSNIPNGYAILLPKNPSAFAEKFRMHVWETYHIKVPVIITDSKTIPLRRGTTGSAIGVAGMNPIIDERGHDDLFGSKMLITTKAIADNIATVGNILMGETNERTPFAIVRDVKYEKSDSPDLNIALMPPDQCLYFAPFMKLWREQL